MPIFKKKTGKEKGEDEKNSKDGESKEEEKKRKEEKKRLNWLMFGAAEAGANTLSKTIARIHKPFSQVLCH